MISFHVVHGSISSITLEHSVFWLSFRGFPISFSFFSLLVEKLFPSYFNHLRSHVLEIEIFSSWILAGLSGDKLRTFNFGNFFLVLILIYQVVPMENLNGRRLVEAGDLCERRNGNAVDTDFKRYTHTYTLLLIKSSLSINIYKNGWYGNSKLFRFPLLLALLLLFLHSCDKLI